MGIIFTDATSTNTHVQGLMAGWDWQTDPYAISVLTKYLKILSDTIGLVSLTLTLIRAHKPQWNTHAKCNYCACTIARSSNLALL